MSLTSPIHTHRKSSTLPNDRMETTRRTGVVALGLLMLLFLVTYLLQAAMGYPKIYIEKPAVWYITFAQDGLSPSLLLLGLLPCGILIYVLSRRLSTASSTADGKPIQIVGAAVAVAWGISGIGSALFVVSGTQSGTAQDAPIAAWLLVVVSAIIAPLLLAVWISLVGRTQIRPKRAFRVLGILAALGLIISALRSVIWLINAGLPPETGHFALSGLLSVLAWVLDPLGLVWLFFLSMGLLRGHIGQSNDNRLSQPRRPVLLVILRRNLFRVGTLVAILVFVVIRAAMMIHAPTIYGDAVPSEPSLSSSLFYAGALMPMRILTPATTDKMVNAPHATVQEPSNIGVTTANIPNVPANMYCAPGADKQHVVLYIHGGGFIAGLSNDYRQLAGILTQSTGACVLLPDYRLAPANPYPAGFDDSLAAYHWLLAQGIAASNTVIAGDSAGGNLALAVTVSLRDHGDPLPAALYLDSPALDLAATGDTMSSKAVVDPLNSPDFVKNAYALYLGGDLSKMKDPYASPFYASLAGLPPTLIQVGSEEVLLSDSTRVAEKMRAAGDTVILEIWPGMWHTFPFVGLHIQLPETTLALQQTIDYFKRFLGK